MGRSIINWGGIVDNQLDGNSDHPLTNRAATAEFLRQQNLMNEQITQVMTLINAVKALTATISSKGMTQLTTSNNVTDANAYALSGIEKNTSIAGTLANLMQSNNSTITSKIDQTNRTLETLESRRICNEYIRDIREIFDYESHDLALFYNWNDPVSFVPLQYSMILRIPALDARGALCLCIHKTKLHIGNLNWENRTIDWVEV